VKPICTVSVSASSALTLLLFMAVTGVAGATDTYTPASRQLAIPALTIGGATYADAVVTIAGIVSGPSGSAPNGTQDSYSPASRQLTAPSVRVGSKIYDNAVATVGSLVSVGSVIGADSYDGKNLTIPFVQVDGGVVYRNVVVTVRKVVSAGGGMPTQPWDTYSSAGSQLAIPAVQYNGHVYTNVIATVANVQSFGGGALAGLHVSGNQILNGENQAVPLRGVDKSGSEYECLYGGGVFDGPADAASVTTLGTWGISVVRLPLNEDCWLGINNVPIGGSTYQSAIVDYVNLLTAGNMATILDLHWAAPGGTQSNQQTPMPDADHAPAFWTSVAQTFKSNSSVIFDLYNEPYPDNNADSAAAWACLKDGGSCPGVSYQAASTQSLVDAIRATGSTNIIMVPGVQYTNSLSQWLANKPADPTGNLAASWHSYSFNSCNSQSCWDAQIKPVLQAVPLITGEIGETDCQDLYVNPLMAYLDDNGGNYLAWAWDTYDCSSFPSLIADYAGTPTAFGIGVRNHLLMLDGRKPPAPMPAGIPPGTSPEEIVVPEFPAGNSPSLAARASR
jgi:hypothetical protein